MFPLIDKSGDPSGLIVLVGCIILIITIFLISRQFVLWYWRITEAVDSLGYIAINLAKINRSLEKLIKTKKDKNKELSNPQVKI